MSGQLINFHKSALYPRKDTCKMTTNIITKMLGVRLMNKDDKYLGNPLVLGRWKSTSYDSLVLKIKSKINLWKSVHLFQAGRNTLVKSVTSALPIYNMSILKFSKDTIDEMDKLLYKFWWGGDDEKRNMHTIKWKEICKFISKGGLVNRDSENNNLALLVKTWWRYLQNNKLTMF